ncbi:WD40/YVTN/BNR-like repeat-containing protein [Caldalkalibacillus salinus]|uniref:WD40/YVTN/BNR-like repeat-containing protein n=1 Tax=Caldalkalibacillus salinus TaxID=2803787 RepID=UPI0019243855|nr:glycosyl hydrolase [Caldalkalibacillus salinus]
MRTFYLGMEDELYKIEETANGYVTTSHLQGTQPTSVAQDPQNKNRIYCATFGHGLWKSEDGGASWRAIGKVSPYYEPVSGDGIRSAHVTAVAVHPYKQSNGNSIVYVGTEPSALYYSKDNGESWTEFKGIQTLPSKANWQFPPRPHTHHVRWITPSYVDENHLGVSVEFGAFISTKDHGESWNDRPIFSPLDTHTLLAHPHCPGRLYAACGDGLITEGHAYAESEDEGQTWTFMSEGLDKHPYLYNMVLNPNDPNDRLVSASVHAREAHHASLHSTVYRKKGERPWVEIADGLPCEGSYSHVLASDPVDENVFYAMSNKGLYRLDQQATKWMKVEIEWKASFDNQHPSCLLITAQ